MKPRPFKVGCGFVGFLLLFWIGAPARAQVNDFDFYKKYGHTSKVWDDMVKKGFEAYDKQDCNTALTALKEAIAAQAQDGLVFYKVAICSEVTGTPYTALQYYQLAEEKLQKLNAMHPYQRDVAESYGRALFQAKRFDQAYPYLMRAVAVGNPSFGLFYMAGYIHMMKNDPRAALEMFERALAQDTTGVPPTTLASVYREVAKAYHANKNHQKAMELIGMALKLNPQDPESQKIHAEISNIAQQQSVMQMLDGMTQQPLPNANPQTAPQSAPPPPAAAKLPPLNPAPQQDPTPPLGTVVPPGTPSTPPMTPLPPAQP